MGGSWSRLVPCTLLAWMLACAPAAAAPGGEGDFSCRASALRTPVAEPVVAGGTGACVTAARSAPALDASTSAAPDGGSADAAVGRVVLGTGPASVEVVAARAHATAACDQATAAPILDGASSVGSVRVNGKLLRDVSDARTIAVGAATLRLNTRTLAGGELTQRAVELTVGGTTMVAGEAVAGVERCVPRPSGPPTAVLEVEVPEDACGTRDDGVVDCDGRVPRAAWAHSVVPFSEYGVVRFFCQWPDDHSCVDHSMPCGQKDFYSLCAITYTYRATSSVDPDDDIVSWSLDFGDGTSASGDWATDPPTEVRHEYQIHYCPTCSRAPATLTVTDSAGHTDTDSQLVYHDYPD